MDNQRKSELMCKTLRSDVQGAVGPRVVISNVMRCVEELVLNSIDAGATGVEVLVNLDFFRVKVEDNGNGTSRENLEVLGTRHMTSKCQSLDDLDNLKTYGFRGKALASIAQVASTVEVISKSKTSTTGHAYRRKFKNGKGGDVTRVSDEVIKFHGFIAIVDGLFGKQPQERQKIDKKAELQGIKSCLEYISLINPSVTITFRDESNGTLLLRTICSESMLDSFKRICQRKQNVAEQHLMKFAFTQEEYHVSGCISQDWHPTKSLQFIYINRRLVADSKVAQILSQKLAPLLGYNSGSQEGGSSCAKLTAKKNSSRAAGPAEKFPMFVVNINGPPGNVDIIYEPSKTLANFVSNADLTELIATLLRQVGDEMSLLSKQTEIPDDKKSLQQKPVVITQKTSNMVTHHANKFGKRKTMSESGAGSSAPKPLLGREITVHDMKRVIHSRPAVREKIETTCQGEEHGELQAKKVCQNDLRSMLRMMLEGEQQSSTSSDVNGSSTNNVQDLGVIAPPVKLCKKVQDEVLPTRRRNDKRKHQDDDSIRALQDKRRKRSTVPKEPKPKTMKKRKGFMTYIFPAFKANSGVHSSVEGTPIRRSEADVNDLNISNVFNRSCSVSEDSPYNPSRDEESSKRAYAQAAIRKTALYFLCEKYVVPDYGRIMSKKLHKIIQEHPSYEHMRNVLKRENALVESVATDDAVPAANNNYNSDYENSISEYGDNNIVYEDRNQENENSNSEYGDNNIVYEDHNQENENHSPVGNNNNTSLVFKTPMQSFARQGMCRVSYMKPSAKKTTLRHPIMAPPPPPQKLYVTTSQNNRDSQVSHERPVDDEAYYSLLHHPVLNLPPLDELLYPKSHHVNDEQGRHLVHDDGGSTCFSSSSLATTNTGTSRWAGNFSTGTVLRNLFPSTSKSFWDSTKQKEGMSKSARMGNINLLQNEEIMIGDAVRSGLGEEGHIGNDLMTHKWQENCLQEPGKYFRTFTGEPMEVDQREEKSRNVQGGLSEMPIVNDNAVEMNTWRKKVTTSLPFPCQFSKADLTRTVVIGNVDRKFIASKIPIGRTCKFDVTPQAEMLVLFDQHAVHERICLERLIDGNLQERGNGERSIVSVDIFPSLQMNFTGSEVRVMESNQHAFGLVGLKFGIVGPFTVRFFAAPKCFAEKVAKEPILNKDRTAQRLLQSLVRDQVDYINKTNGAVQTLPSTIMDVLRSQACRGAIKFGDELSFEDCVNLIHDLKNCHAPFQCAHGRPVLVPLGNLNDINF